MTQTDAVTDVQEVIFELINQRKLEKALTLLNGLETKSKMKMS